MSKKNFILIIILASLFFLGFIFEFFQSYKYDVLESKERELFVKQNETLDYNRAMIAEIANIYSPEFIEKSITDNSDREKNSDLEVIKIFTPSKEESNE